MENNYIKKKFVQMPIFSDKWDKEKLTNEDLRKLEIEIGNNLETHPVIRGSGGLRKVRFVTENDQQGKSGSYRALYLPLENDSLILLILLFGKKEKDNLSDDELNQIKVIVQNIKKSARKQRNS